MHCTAILVDKSIVSSTAGPPEWTRATFALPPSSAHASVWRPRRVGWLEREAIPTSSSCARSAAATAAPCSICQRPTAFAASVPLSESAPLPPHHPSAATLPHYCPMHAVMLYCTAAGFLLLHAPVTVCCHQFIDVRGSAATCCYCCRCWCWYCCPAAACRLHARSSGCPRGRCRAPKASRLGSRTPPAMRNPVPSTDIQRSRLVLCRRRCSPICPESPSRERHHEHRRGGLGARTESKICIVGREGRPHDGALCSLKAPTARSAGSSRRGTPRRWDAIRAAGSCAHHLRGARADPYFSLRESLRSNSRLDCIAKRLSTNGPSAYSDCDARQEALSSRPGKRRSMPLPRVAPTACLCSHCTNALCVLYSCQTSQRLQKTRALLLWHQ